MSAANQLPVFIGLLTAAIICGAWWYAAIRKRKVAIFYWLAAAHTLSLAVHLLQVSYTLTNARVSHWESIGAMYMLIGIVMAALYVVLVRWLVDQP